MRYLLALLLMVTGCQAASPSFSSFNTNQFSTNNLFISIKDGVLITNLNTRSFTSLPGETMTLNNVSITNWTDITGLTTINPTDNYLPYRSNATTFGDSPWYRISTNAMGFNGTNWFLIQNDDGNDTHHSLSLGRDALISVLTSTGWGEATAIGFGALREAITAGASTAIGWEAGAYSTNITSSVMVGFSAGGADNITQSTAIGAGAGQGTGTSASDTSVGYIAGATLGGSTNTVIGASVSQGIVQTTSLTSVGYLSGSFVPNTNNRIRSYDTFIGTLSGTTTVDADSTNSIAIGFQAATRGSNTAQIGTNGVSVLYLNGTVGWFRGTGTPEAAVTAGVGSYFTREDGASGTTLYTKTSGTGNTGWEALSVAGSGGSSLWTNITGYVTMIPGQTATNTLSFVSGAADNATNILFNVDSANYLSASGTLLASFGNAGTNRTRILSDGTLVVGSVSAPYTGATLLSKRSASVDGTGYNEIYIEGSDGVNTSSIDVFVSPEVFDAAIDIYGAAGGQASLSVTNSHPFLELLDEFSVQRSFMDPSVASTGSAVAYLFDTSNTLTNGDSFATFGNAGVPLITLAPAEAGNPAAQIIFGPGATNVLYRSGSNLVYTNGTVGTVSFEVRGGAAASATATLGVTIGAHAFLQAGSGRSVFVNPNLGATSIEFGSSFIAPASGTVDVGTGSKQFRDVVLSQNIVWNGGTNTLFDSWGIATPEASKTARPGSIFRNTSDSGVAYVKTDGTGNTGWQPVHVGNQAYQATNITSVDATMANLSLSVGVINAKKYSFVLTLFCANSTPADGIKIDFDGGSATATNFRAHAVTHDTALAGSQQVSALATDFTVATITGDSEMVVKGSFEPSASGTFIPRFAENADTGGTLTVYRGSNLILTEIP